MKHESTTTSRAKLIIPLGRGSRGKTVLLRWAVERARRAGRAVLLADVDRTNQGLRKFFPDAMVPPAASDPAVREWMAEQVERQITDGSVFCYDFGGGDLLVKQIARDMGLVEFLTAYGITPVALHCIGADVDDLAYLRDVEEGGVFAPAETAVIFNLGVAAGHRDPLEAFRAVATHPTMAAVLARGAKLCHMPRLDVMHMIDERVVGFAEATDGAKGLADGPIGPWGRQVIKRWLEAMETEFAPLAAMLP